MALSRLDRINAKVNALLSELAEVHWQVADERQQFFTRGNIALFHFSGHGTHSGMVEKPAS